MSVVIVIVSNIIYSEIRFCFPCVISLKKILALVDIVRECGCCLTFQSTICSVAAHLTSVGSKKL